MTLFTNPPQSLIPFERFPYAVESRRQTVEVPPSPATLLVPHLVSAPEVSPRLTPAELGDLYLSCLLYRTKSFEAIFADNNPQSLYFWISQQEAEYFCREKSGTLEPPTDEQLRSAHQLLTGTYSYLPRYFLDRSYRHVFQPIDDFCTHMFSTHRFWVGQLELNSPDAFRWYKQAAMDNGHQVEWLLNWKPHWQAVTLPPDADWQLTDEDRMVEISDIHNDLELRVPVYQKGQSVYLTIGRPSRITPGWFILRKGSRDYDVTQSGRLLDLDDTTVLPDISPWIASAIARLPTDRMVFKSNESRWKYRRRLRQLANQVLEREGFPLLESSTA